MNNKFYIKIRQILLNKIVLTYKINKTRNELIKNLKNFGLLEQQLKGGGKNLTVEYNNETFIFIKLDNEYSTIVTYVLQAKNNDSDCIVISIDKELNRASIDNLTTNELQCSNSIVNNIGSHLIELTIKLLKKYKNKFNINKILISDHSFLFCSKAKVNINLADLYTLKHGITFYGKFGFIPYDNNPILNMISTINSNKTLNKKFNKNKEIIKILKVCDSKLLDYLEKFQTKIKYDISKIIDYVKQNQNKLLSEIIKTLSSKDNFENTCEILNYIIPKLIKLNNLTSFHNKAFELNI